MRTINRKWWLTTMAVLLLLPAAFATPVKSHQRHRQSFADPTTLTMPEGGSAFGVRARSGHHMSGRNGCAVRGPQNRSNCKLPAHEKVSVGSNADS